MVFAGASCGEVGLNQGFYDGGSLSIKGIFLGICLGYRWFLQRGLGLIKSLRVWGVGSGVYGLGVEFSVQAIWLAIGSFVF